MLRILAAMECAAALATGIIVWLAYGNIHTGHDTLRFAILTVIVTSLFLSLQAIRGQYSPKAFELRRAWRLFPTALHWTTAIAVTFALTLFIGLDPGLIMPGLASWWVMGLIVLVVNRIIARKMKKQLRD